MIKVCNCYLRKCKHFVGVIQPDGTEESERYVCKAFLDKIPDEIAFGENKHLEPTKEQKNEVVYEPKTLI